MPKENTAQMHKSKIGGQALIEGIMMRGVEKSSMAVRLPTGEIDTEIWDTEKSKSKFGEIKKIPLVRGIFNMVSSLLIGYKCMMKSAEKSGMDEVEDGEMSKLDLWLEKKLGDNMMKVVIIIGAVLGVACALCLFMFLPSLAVWGLNKVVELGMWKGLIEGAVKIVIFVGYLALVSKMKEIHRVFQYHGAEHKTIFCFESGLDLTIENIKKQNRFHPRCGTSFLILVLIISILINSVITWSNPILRTVLKLALLPVVIGIAYELIKIAGKYDNLFTKIISFPGLKLQHLTTKEPSDDQIEVAIAAMKPVIPDDLEKDQW